VAVMSTLENPCPQEHNARRAKGYGQGVDSVTAVASQEALQCASTSFGAFPDVPW
jgi:hypothetical protein